MILNKETEEILKNMQLQGLTFPIHHLDYLYYLDLYEKRNKKVILDLDYSSIKTRTIDISDEEF